MNRTERRRLTRASNRRDLTLWLRFKRSCDALGMPGLIRPPRQFRRFFNPPAPQPDPPMFYKGVRLEFDP